MTEENKTTPEADKPQVEGEIVDPTERMIRFTSPMPVPSGSTGQVPIPGPVALRSLSADDAETEIVNVLALGRQIVRAEGQTWRTALAGVEIKPGSFAIVVVRNLAKTTRVLQIVVTGGSPSFAQAETPTAQQPVARISQQAANGPVRSFGRPSRAMTASHAPPVGVREKQGAPIITTKERGEIVHVGKASARMASAGVRTTESTPFRVVPVGSVPATAPTAPVASSDAAPVAPPVATIGPITELDEIESPSAEPRRTVAILKGHAFALLRYLELKVPLPEAFIGSIRQRLITAQARHVDVKLTGASDLVVRLTLDQIQVLESLLRMRVSSASIGADVKGPIITALKSAFARDKQRTSQVTASALTPASSSHEQVSVGTTP